MESSQVTSKEAGAPPVRSSQSPGGAGAANRAAPSPTGTASLNFNGIRLNASADIGQFRTANDQFGWRVRKAALGSDALNRKPVQYEASQVKNVSWLCIGSKEYELKVNLKDGDTVRFEGFKEQDFPSLQKHLKQFWGLELPKSKVATRGWNWGEGHLEGKNFNFSVDGKVAFQLPSQIVNQVSASKGDITLVLDLESNKENVEDQLLELRMFVPPPKSGEDIDGAAALKNQFLALAGSKASSVKSLCTIPDVKVLVPAGRFELVISRHSVKLQGKSNDFTIEFSNITRMYLLHSGSSPHMNLVLSLTTPLRKGATQYPNVVIQFDDKKVIDIEIALTEEEIKNIEDSHTTPNLNTKLQPTMSGVIYDLVSRVLRCLSNRQMVVPGDFRSASGQQCFRCSHKADSGNFYPLNKLFIFIPKPVIIIMYEDIANVSFERTSGSQTKLFEFDVFLKGGATYSFSSVDRQESGPFVEFLHSRNIKAKSITQGESAETENQSILGPDLPSDESDDEDFEAGEDDDSDDESSDEDEEEEEEEENEERKKPKKRKRENTTPPPASTKKRKTDKPSSSSSSSSSAGVAGAG